MPENSDARDIINNAIASATPQEVDPTKAYSIVVPEMAHRDLLDLEPLLPTPRRARGTVHLHTGESLVAFLADHADSELQRRLYADWRTASVWAVLNDDLGDNPGWRDHRVVLQLRKTPEWKRWEEHDRQLQNQTTFAELVEEGIDDIVNPPGADLLEMAQEFNASRNLTFRSSKRLANGQTQFVYNEDIEARSGKSGETVVPGEFVLALSPYEGSEAVTFSARIRYRLDSGSLRIGYVLDRPEKVLRDAFDTVLLAVETNSSMVALRGAPPAEYAKPT